MSRMPLVADLMDRQFRTITPDTRIKEAVDLFVNEKLIGVLVVDAEGTLAGIFSEKDCLRVIIQNSFHQFPDDTVENYMHKVLATVDSKTDILTVAQMFLANNFRRLPVVDDGRLVGQITRRDIVRGMRKYR
jgi:CBS domain-containing protein